MNKMCMMFGLVTLVTTSTSCSPSEQGATTQKDPSVEQAVSATPTEGTWLRGNVDERFELVAKHLRGFDMAMVEVGHRYTELYWASRDGNWDYAEYQLRKIETAVANGIERRPRRAASARMLDGTVQQVRTAITERDGPGLDAALDALTTICNACHEAEQVGFMTVAPPSVRLSPVRFGTAAGGRPDRVTP